METNDNVCRDMLAACPLAGGYVEAHILRWVNKAFLKLFALDNEDDVCGKSIFSFLAAGEDRTRIRDFFDRDFNGDEGRIDAVFLRKSGSVFSGSIISNGSSGSRLPGTVFSILDISQLIEQTETTLRKQEHTLQNILAASPVAICMLENRTFVWVNPAMLKIFGADSEDFFVGNNSRMVYGSNEEYERVGELLYRAEQGAVAETEATLVRANGAPFHGFIRISASDPDFPTKGTIATITDRSPIKEAQAALIASHARFREILENIRLISVCLDTGANITFCNNFLVELSDSTREELIGRNWFDVFQPWESRRSRRGWYKSLMSGAIPTHNEGDIAVGNSEKRFIVWNNTILRDHFDNVIGIAAIGEDVTEQKKASELLLQTERVKAVGEMAGAVAHNFNNLLQIVMSGAQLASIQIESGTLNQVKPTLDQIIQNCRMGAQTVRRLQEFARVRHSDENLFGFEFDVSNTLRQAAEMSEPWWKTGPEKDGIKISLSMELEKDCRIIGKENEIFEVIINLIKNAAEALPLGGAINISSRQDAEHVYFDVKDNGTGISEDHLPKIFQPFWTTKGMQGTGMGLAGCYALLTRHKGTISVKSSRGRGTKFSVKIPKSYIKPRTDQPGPKSTHGSPLRVLLIDDMEAVVSILEHGLIDFGHTVIAAVSGSRGIELFKNTHFDVVVCDLGMEGMNGWQVSDAVRHICKERSEPKTPFVLLTGWGDQLLEDENVTKFGVDRVAGKPILVSDLLEILHEVVETVQAKNSNPLDGTICG
jgi:PAS domain S-box-containing protein